MSKRCLSIITVEMACQKDIYPEDIVDIADKHALAPVYSFLAEEDQHYYIQKIHSEKKTSVAVVDEVKNELALQTDLQSYSVRSSHYGMLHPYNTVIGIEKTISVPLTGYEEYEI